MVEFNDSLNTLYVISGTVFTANLLAVNSSFYRSNDPTNSVAVLVVQIRLQSNQDHIIWDHIRKHSNSKDIRHCQRQETL